jgi:hypothetical protein
VPRLEQRHTDLGGLSTASVRVSAPRRLVYRIRARQRTESQGRALRGRNRPRWDGWRKTPAASVAGDREGAPSHQKQMCIENEKATLWRTCPEWALSKIDKC